MKPSTRSFLHNISRLFYTGGTVLLLAGMLLSMVNQPVKADAPGPVSKRSAPWHRRIRSTAHPGKRQRQTSTGSHYGQRSSP